MIEELRKEFTPFKFLVYLLIIAVLIYLLQIFSNVIANFSDVIFTIIIAWLLSFILEPVVNLTSGLLKLERIFAALLVYLLLGALIVILFLIFIPLVSSQLQTLATLVPQYFSAFPQFVKTWDNYIGNSAGTVITFIPSVAGMLIDLILLVFLSFYLIVDKDRINNEIYRLTPKQWHKNMGFVQKVIDESFASFLRIQFIFGVIGGISTLLVLVVFGIPYAIAIAVLAGILTIIPLIGPALALIPPIFIALVTNPQNPIIPLAILVILLIIQQIIYNYVGPELMGKAFKLHPIIVLLSIVIGFRIAGVLGAILVVPVLGIVVIVLKELGYHFINPDESS